MLAELAAANAAFQILKKTVENGRELAQAGKAISDFVNAKDTIDKKAREKLSGYTGERSDLQEFLAREEVKRLDDELREFMQWHGRPGLYSDYVKFCTEARKARVEAKKKAERERQQFIDNCLLAFYWLSAIGIGIFALGIFLWVWLEARNV